MVYSWKPGSRIKASAEEAGAVMSRLEASGGLTPKRLVDVSRPEDAPLHNEFEWDDEVAAELYRENQAAHVIRCIVVKTEEKEEPTVRAFFPVHKENPSTYTSIQTIVKRPDLMDTLLEQAVKEMTAFQKKYESIEMLRPLCNEMSNAVKRIRKDGGQVQTDRPVAGVLPRA